MGFPYFIWKNIDSQSMGLWVSQYPGETRAAERVNQVVVPGRAGALTVKEGRYVHEPITRTCRITSHPDADLKNLMAWLSGEGTVIFGEEPERQVKARIVKEVKFANYGAGMKTATVSFECEPYRMRVPVESDIEVTESGTEIYNPGDIEAYPRLKVTGSGNITVTVDGITQDVRGVTDGIVMDSDAQEVYALDGSAAEGVTVHGDFVVIPTGYSSITYTGTVTKIEITPRWRWY